VTTSADKKPEATRTVESSAAGGNMEFILDIPLEVTVELGRTKLLIHELLKLGQGSVIELSKLAGETLEVLANQKLIARGEAVVINEKFGVRLTEVVSPMERIERLR
jgi:flagellar motor switch protein FliN/FliY